MPRKKKTPWKKRCDCRDPLKCAHPWRIRIKNRGGAQTWVNLTEMFPNDPVEAAAIKAKQLARDGKLVIGAPAAGPLTVRDVAKRYRQTRTSNNDVYLAHFADSPGVNGATIGDMGLDAVTTADVKHARDLWKQRPKAGSNGIRHFLQSARHFFNWSIREGYATRTPFKSPQGTTLVQVPKSGKRSRRLEPGEEDRIRAVADDFMNDFLTAILFTGCRPGELRTLQWSEVGERIVILARKAKDREERKLPILPELRDVLDRRRKGPDGHPLPADAHVFGDDTGRLTAIERLCARWRDVCAKAKVVNLHLHDLRAEFGSRMIEAGVPIHQVRDALGHANVSMTSTYLRSRTDSLDDAYGQLRQHRKGLKLVVNK